MGWWSTRSMKSSATRAPGCEIIPVAAPRCTISMRRKTRYHFVKRAMAAPPGFIERPLFGGAIVAFLPASFKVRGTLAATAGCFAERLVTSQDSSPLPARPPARARQGGLLPARAKPCGSTRRRSLAPFPRAACGWLTAALPICCRAVRLLARPPAGVPRACRPWSCFANSNRT